MKTIILSSFWGFVFCLITYSCESKNDSTQTGSIFKIEFSDGTQIVKNDILFYDSSTHLFFLKNKLVLAKTTTDFNVLVDYDTIYKGIIYPSYLSSMPRTAFYIYDYLYYGSNILNIYYISYSKDLRNDPRIINSLKNDNLLRNGISCKIDNIVVKSFDDHAEVICQITIKNNDYSGYYILDPAKMGDVKFNYYTGGVSFQNIETKSHVSLRWTEQYPDWNEITMNDFTLIQANSTASFTFSSSDYPKLENGSYIAKFSFQGSSSNHADLKSEQPDGRIWVGSALATKELVIAK